SGTSSHSGSKGRSCCCRATSCRRTAQWIRHSTGSRFVLSIRWRCWTMRRSGKGASRRSSPVPGRRTELAVCLREELVIPLDQPSRGRVAFVEAHGNDRLRSPSMPFQSIEPRRLYRQIADQIRGLIKGGEFPTGSRLPPERDLARQLGVSRPSVREALIALEVEGMVEVRIGSGIYVLAGTAPHAANGLVAPAGPVELLRPRHVLQSQ